MTTPRMAGHPAASQQAVVEAALLMLRQMGLSPDDLVAAPKDRTSHRELDQTRSRPWQPVLAHQRRFRSPPTRSSRDPAAGHALPCG